MWPCTFRSRLLLKPLGCALPGPAHPWRLAIRAGCRAPPAAPAPRKRSASSRTGRPRPIRKAGRTVCYAFARAQIRARRCRAAASRVLTVTERPTGRDTVAISAGFTYRAPMPRSRCRSSRPSLGFYTAGRNAFARDGAAAVAAFRKGRAGGDALPGAARQRTVTDTFSLRGFSAAYEAISKACPAEVSACPSVTPS